MFNLIKADLFKLRKSAAVRVLSFITVIGAAVMLMMAYWIPRNDSLSQFNDIGFLFSDVNVMSILGSILAGWYIGGDFDNKTTQDAVAGGYGRFTVIAGKAVVYGIGLLLLLVPYMAASGIALWSGASFDMGNVSLGYLYLATAGGGEAAKQIAVGLVIGLNYLAQLSICLPLAFALKRPVFVVGIYYAFSMAIAQLSRLSEDVPAMKFLFSLSPYASSYIRLSGSSSAGILLQASAASLFFALAMTGIALALFRKSEIK